MSKVKDFFKGAFEDMKKSAKAQHEVDKANFAAAKAESKAQWEEAKAMCLKAAQKVPQLRFIAWDVAITADGPRFIEGNSFPSHAIPQFAAHYPDGIGILGEFRKFIDL